MIAHPLKAVFVHIPKTAGQSVEQVFLSYLGLDQQSRAALLLREKTEHEQGPPRLAHLTASEYTEFGYLNNEQFSEYFSFSFVRNPWSRVKSFYSYLKFDEKMPFEQFVLDELLIQMQGDKYGWFLKPQVNYVLDENGSPLVDFVGRFEDLQSDFDIIMQRLDLPKTELPIINSSGAIIDDATNKPSPIEYPPEMIDKVAKLYAQDVAAFKYEFE